MNLEIDGKVYTIVIEYKRNKNMYLRIKDDLTIYITAPYGIKIDRITSFVEKNIPYIKKHLLKKEELQQKLNNKFLYLGESYDICFIEQNKIVFGKDKIFIGKNFNINNWYKKQALEIFKEHYDNCFANFKETNFKPVLKIRKMKSKWGVCNMSSKTITLNLDLIKLDTKYLDYVIYHELSHIIHMNHSTKFWQQVSKYVPNYKTIRKEMNNIL